jgi:SAM-dependent methyltransferase
MSQYTGENKKLWNEWTGIHVKSAFYDVEGFKQGKNSIDQIELEGVGDVAGKSLLHLQCHFGMTTLSFARLGAQVTGIDFSEEAVAQAQALSQELNLPARFICSDIYDAPNKLNEQFDIVFTSYGVLSWLPDMAAWAKVVAHFLKPDGKFFIAEAHPFAYVFDRPTSLDDLKIVFPYSNKPDEPFKFEVKGSYADKDAEVKHNVEYGWNHSLTDIIGGLLKAGLKITDFNEYFHCVWEMFPGMIRSDDNTFRLAEKADSLPLMFSITATK